MAITFVAVGAVAHANTASVQPALPAGHTTADILIAFDANRADGTSAAAGYTELHANGSTSRRFTALSKTDGGTEAEPTIAVTGNANSHSALLCAIRGSTGELHGSPVSQLNGNVDLTIEYPALTITQDGCVVFLFVTHNDDLGVGAYSFDTPAGFTKAGEFETQLGSDHSGAVYYQIQTTATSIGSGTVTKSGGGTAVSAAMLFALLPTGIAGAGLTIANWQPTLPHLRM